MTSAEGGMIVTNDDKIAEESRIYRDQGKASFTVNAHVRMGYNWRMSEPHAIIGLRHLERLPGNDRGPESDCRHLRPRACKNSETCVRCRCLRTESAITTNTSPF